MEPAEQRTPDSDPIPATARHVLDLLERPRGLADGDESYLVQAKRRAAVAPDAPASHAALGWCYLHADRLSLAARSYRVALESDSEHIPAILGLAAVHLLSGDMAEGGRWLAAAGLGVSGLEPVQAAEPAVLPAVTTDDTTSRTHGAEIEAAYEAAVALDRADCPKESLDALDALLETAHDHLPTLHRRAKVLARLGRTQDARHAYAAVLDREPRHVRAWCGLGVVLGRNGDDDAINAFTQAIEIDPSYGRAHTNLGICHRRRGEIEDAINCYQRALECDPHDLEARYDLAITLFEQERFDDAAELYRKILEQDPGHVRASCGLGTTLYEQGHIAEAIESYRLAISADAEDPHAHYFLGIAELAAENEAGALREYRILQAFDPALAMQLFSAIYPE